MAKCKRNEFDDLLDKVTSNFKLESDAEATLQICNLINEHKCTPQHALLSLNKKLCDRNPHVVFLALLVFESLEKNCGGIIHDEVVTESYMENLSKIVQMTKDRRVKTKIVELIQKIDPRLTKKHFLDPRNILFIADKEYDCFKCDAVIKHGEEMRNCQTCRNAFCVGCSLTFAEFDIEKEGGVCEACYEKGEMKSPELKPANISKGEEVDDEEMPEPSPENCFTCKTNIETEEKVHCESCRRNFCSGCASKKAELPFASGEKSVCDSCYLLQEGPNSLPPSDDENLADQEEDLIIIGAVKIPEPKPEGARALTPLPNPVGPEPYAYIPRLPLTEPNFRAVNLTEDEQFQLAITLSLNEENNFVPEQEEVDLAVAFSLSEQNGFVKPADDVEDAQLATALATSKELQKKKLEESLAIVFGEFPEENCNWCKLNPVKKSKSCKSCEKLFCENCVIKTPGKQGEVCKTCLVILKVTGALKSAPSSKKSLEKKDVSLPVDGDGCRNCRNQFSNVRRKEICKACGNLFCQECLTLSSPLPVLGILKEVKVCDACYDFHNRQKILQDQKKLKELEEENKRLKQAAECIICLDYSKNVIFFPCNHLVVCEKCGAGQKKCPVCRQIIQSFKKVYSV